MTKDELATTYRGYIDCLNRQAWAELGLFVAQDIIYNGEGVGLGGYQSMLERDYRDIPDLAFNIQILTSDPPTLASRLNFKVTPRAQFLGLGVNGRQVEFCENVFYTFIDGKIAQVWSVIDKAAIERQL